MAKRNGARRTAARVKSSVKRLEAENARLRKENERLKSISPIVNVIPKQATEDEVDLYGACVVIDKIALMRSCRDFFGIGSPDELKAEGIAEFTEGASRSIVDRLAPILIQMVNSLLVDEFCPPYLQSTVRKKDLSEKQLTVEALLHRIASLLASDGTEKIVVELTPGKWRVMEKVASKSPSGSGWTSFLASSGSAASVRTPVSGATYVMPESFTTGAALGGYWTPITYDTVRAMKTRETLAKPASMPASLGDRLYESMKKCAGIIKGPEQPEDAT